MHNLIIENLKRLLKEKKFKEVIKHYTRNKKNFTSVSDKINSGNIFAIALINLKKFAEAEQALEEILNFDNNNLEILTNLGAAYFALNKIDQALTCFDEAIKLDDNFTDVQVFKIRALAKKGYHELLSFYETIENNLSNVNNKVLSEIAENFFNLNDYSKAEKIYEHLIHNQNLSQNIFLLNRLALCYESRLLNEKSENLYKKILKIEPKYIDANLNYASFLRSIGKVKQSTDLLNYVLNIILSAKNSIFNFLPEVLRQLTLTHKFKNLDDSLLKQMLSLLSSKKIMELDKNDISQLYFALGKAFEDLHEFENSSKMIVKGNELRRQTIQYNEGAILSQFEMMKSLINKDFVKKNTLKMNNISPKPIFIIGMPRSGTTLCEQIISTNNHVFSGGELYFFQNLIKKYFKFREVEKFAEDVNKNFHIKSKFIREEYLNSLKNFPLKSHTFVTDKHPFNFIFVGFIKCIFPESKIVYCKRNSYDNCLSIYKNYFPMNGIGFAYNQVELATYYKAHKNFMDYFMKLFSDSIYCLNYEDLVLNQEGELKKLLKYLNFDWSNNYLKFNKNKQTVKTLSVAQVRNEIYQTSINSSEKFRSYFKFLFEALDR